MASEHTATRQRRYFSLGVLSLLVLVPLLLLPGCAAHKAGRPDDDLSGYRQKGKASYYAKKFQARPTASGEPFNNSAMTAAHKKLPFGTRVLVTNIRNGKNVAVTINDRGPFVRGRIIDLSRAAFAKIEKLNRGLADVEITVVD